MSLNNIIFLMNKIFQLVSIQAFENTLVMGLPAGTV